MQILVVVANIQMRTEEEKGSMSTAVDGSFSPKRWANPVWSGRAMAYVAPG